MKLILAIVNNDDSARVSAALTEAGFGVTKLTTSGGFLMVGNTTLLIGTEDENTDKAIGILEHHCTTRKQVSSPTASYGLGMTHMSVPEEVQVGGATIFVLDVAQMKKI
ncbi:MAG: transcriptional regulator [Lachnospiraceae bacterium]|nr:transcriptional regulator [Lachnospiraceae bacterium]